MQEIHRELFLMFNSISKKISSLFLNTKMSNITSVCSIYPEPHYCRIDKYREADKKYWDSNFVRKCKEF
jgi:hypothetical protein